MSTPPLSAGTRVGAYAIESPLARSRLGDVYAARTPDGSRVAVRLLTGIAGNPGAMALFAEAVTAWRNLDHPNIQQVLATGDLAGVPYIAGPLVEGGDLAMAENRELDVAEAMGILGGVAAALDHAHAAGVLHGHMTPQNILVERGGVARVADFGIAGLAGQPAELDTEDIAYDAPEQAGTGRSTPASDRYALAVIAYELFTGRRPFEAGTAMALRYAQVHQAAPAPSSLRPEVPPAVDPVLLRGLEKEPQRRWPSATAMVEALQAALSRPARAIETQAPPPAPEKEAEPPLSYDAAALRHAAGIARFGRSTAAEDEEPSPAPPLEPPRTWLYLSLVAVVVVTVILIVVLTHR